MRILIFSNFKPGGPTTIIHSWEVVACFVFYHCFSKLLGVVGILMPCMSIFLFGIIGLLWALRRLSGLTLVFMGNEDGMSLFGKDHTRRLFSAAARPLAGAYHPF